MRMLNDFEKYLINQMIDKEWYGNLNIPNLLDEYLKGVRIRIIRDKNKVEILFEIQNPQPTEKETKEIIDKVGEINQIIISTVNLINLLEKEGYIILFNSATQIDNEITFGQGAVNLPSISYSFPDERTKELLIEYATKQIIITSELEDYKKNNFLTKDEIRFRKNIKLAWTAIIISIISTLMSFGFNLYNTLKQDDNRNCDCEYTLIKELEKIDTNTKKIIEINRNILEKDTVVIKNKK